jgi:hypothetical protein
MNDSKIAVSRTQPPVVLMLASLLERLERMPGPVVPRQYRWVAQRLAEELQRTPDDERLRAMLQSLPSAAEVWENLHYAHAGLCRQDLDAALAAEKAASALIARARRACGPAPRVT